MIAIDEKIISKEDSHHETDLSVDKSNPEVVGKTEKLKRSDNKEKEITENKVAASGTDIGSIDKIGDILMHDDKVTVMHVSDCVYENGSTNNDSKCSPKNIETIEVDKNEDDTSSLNTNTVITEDETSSLNNNTVITEDETSSLNNNTVITDDELTVNKEENCSSEVISKVEATEHELSIVNVCSKVKDDDDVKPNDNDGPDSLEVNDELEPNKCDSPTLSIFTDITEKTFADSMEETIIPATEISDDETKKTEVTNGERIDDKGDLKEKKSAENITNGFLKSQAKRAISEVVGLSGTDDSNSATNTASEGSNRNLIDGPASVDDNDSGDNSNQSLESVNKKQKSTNDVEVAQKTVVADNMVDIPVEKLSPEEVKEAIKSETSEKISDQQAEGIEERSTNNSGKRVEDSSSTNKNTEEASVPLKAGQKRAIDDVTEVESRKSLKKIRIFNSTSQQKYETTATTNIMDVKKHAEVESLTKCLEADKSKSEKCEAIKSTASSRIPMLYPGIDQNQIERLASMELEKLGNKTVKNRKLQRISRKDLENIVVQLFADTLFYEHELGQQRDLCKRLEATLEGNRKKAAQFHKEIDDLQKVTQRLQAEYNARKGQIVTPVKVKRSVGIHVTPNIIAKGIASHESVTNNVRFISPTHQNIPETTPGQKFKTATIVTDMAVQTPTVSKSIAPAGLSNTTKTIVLPTGQTASNSTTIVSAKPKSGIIDLTDDEEVSKSLLKTPLTAMGGTNMVAIPRTAINLASSGQFVTVAANNIQAVNATPAIRAPTVTTPVGINMSQGGFNQTATNSPRVIFTSSAVNGSPAVIAHVSQQLRHPAALPKAPPQQTAGFNKMLPPQPILNLSHKDNTGIVLLWKMAKTDEHEAIASYQLYAYQEGSAPPLSSLWKKVGSVKALELPMACTLTQFMSGHTYHFAVRAVDIRNRLGPFSEPKSIRLKK